MKLKRWMLQRGEAYMRFYQVFYELHGHCRYPTEVIPTMAYISGYEN